MYVGTSHYCTKHLCVVSNSLNRIFELQYFGNKKSLQHFFFLSFFSANTVKHGYSEHTYDEFMLTADKLSYLNLEIVFQTYWINQIRI